MIVLDTHAWLWWVDRPTKLSRRAREAIAGADALGVSAASCYELARIAVRGRIALGREPRRWIAQALTGDRVVPLPTTAEIAVRAATLDSEIPGDPIDRVIYATALDADAQLVTKDEALRRYDRARTIW